MQRKTLFTHVGKIASGFLVLILLVSTSIFALPQKAHAIFGVGDIVMDPLTELETTLNITQLAVLNPIAWTIAKSVLQSVVKSSVSSVNKGPNGSPQFVTNLGTQLQTVSDTAANSFISQLATNGSIQSPFQTSVAAAVGNSYFQGTGSGGFFTQNPYTLNQVSQNPAGFYSGNIAQNGGLTAWNSAWGTPANNAFGAQMLATNALGQQTSIATQNQQAELSFGQGFSSSRGKCTTTTTGSSANSIPGLLTSLSPNSTCQSSPIQTPGSTIKAALDKSLGSGIDTLVSAHTFDEIISSILGQLIGQVIGGSGGLSGTTQPSGASTGTTGSGTPAGSTYFDQTDPSQAAISSSLGSSFASTIATQITNIQQFQAQWTKINGAALAAQNALSVTTCYPNAAATLSGTVQPILTQATNSISQANAATTQLTAIQTELTSASTDSTTQVTTIQDATSKYTALVSPQAPAVSILPSPSDLAFALAQSTDTGTSTPPSLYSEMNQITQAAQTCGTIPPGT